MAEQYAMVVNASRRADATGVQIDDKAMHFGRKSNAFKLNDMGLAKEIEAQHGAKGQDVVVLRQPKREAGHRYTFTVPELPWKKVKTDGTTDRITDRPESRGEILRDHDEQRDRDLSDCG